MYSDYVFAFTVSDVDAANQGGGISLVFAGNNATGSFTEFWNAGFVQFNPDGTWGIAKGSVSPTTADYKNPYQCEEYSKIRLSNINDKITVSWFNDGATEATGSFDVTLGTASNLRYNSNGDGYVGMAFSGGRYSVDDVSITAYETEGEYKVAYGEEGGSLVSKEIIPGYDAHLEDAPITLTATPTLKGLNTEPSLRKWATLRRR